MSTLMSYLTGFGLAGGVGAKAFIPVLALGFLHHTEYFELSPRWAWIADPMVMTVLAVLAVAEIAVDSNPDLGEYADLVHYLPKLAIGFIAFAAATGKVDQNLIELSASGLLGSATAGASHFLRSGARRYLRESVEHAHPRLGMVASLGEAGASAVTAGAAIFAPLLGLLAFLGLSGAALGVAWVMDGRRVSCVHCSGPIRPGAVVCPHCQRDQRADAVLSPARTA